LLLLTRHIAIHLDEEEEKKKKKKKRRNRGGAKARHFLSK